MQLRPTTAAAATKGELLFPAIHMNNDILKSTPDDVYGIISLPDGIACATDFMIRGKLYKYSREAEPRESLPGARRAWPRPLRVRQSCRGSRGAAAYRTSRLATRTAARRSRRAAVRDRRLRDLPSTKEDGAFGNVLHSFYDKKADVTTRLVAYDRRLKMTRPAHSTSSSSATAWVRSRPTAVDR